MNNSQVAHKWAQNNGGSATGSHFYFEGDTIYSYGEHFHAGRFYTNKSGQVCVLLNCRNYSSTTAKHMSYIRGALNYGQYVFVQDVPHVNAGENVDKHRENLEYICRLISETAKSCIKARNRLAEYIAEFDALREIAKEYAQFFELKPIKTEDMTSDQRREYEKRIDNLEQAQAIINAKKRQREENRLNEWMIDPSKHGTFFDLPVRLRIVGDRVQTSRGASVELSEAVQAVKMLKSGKLKTGQSIGDFSVDEIESNQVKIGCHTIERAEIDRVFAGVL